MRDETLPRKLQICLSCPHVRLDEALSQRFCNAAGNKISEQCRLGCPHKFHDLPDFAVPPESRGFFPPGIIEARAAWRVIHIYPSTLAEDFDRDDVRRFFAYLPMRLPKGCACRNNFAQLMKDMPPDFSSREALFRWTVQVHNFKNLELGKLQISDARAARIHGVMELLPAQEIAADDSGPIKLLINDGWGVGDAAMMTAAIRYLHAAHPGEFEVRTRGGNYAIFENLPGVISGLTPPKDYAPDIYCHWHLLDHKNDRHMIEWMTERLSAVVNRAIPSGPNRAWLKLSDTEKTWPPPIDRPYIVAAMGPKYNLTIKGYPHWQAVVNAMGDRIAIVRVGSKTKCDVQPEISNVSVDLVGKTSLGQLRAMIAHPLCVGVVSSDTSLPHIASAFDKPTVVIAGDRCRPVAVQYDGHKWLRPELPCSFCFHSRVVALDPKLPWPETNQDLCTHPDGDYAKCMSLIAPKSVARAVIAMIDQAGRCEKHMELDSSRIAVLVLGPESAGTRFLTRLLIAAGLSGSDDLDQPFDFSLDGARERIVWRRSLPYGGIWPDLFGEVLGPLRDRGYAVIVLELTRDSHCLAASQIARGMALDAEHAAANAAKAHKIVGELVKANSLAYAEISYESLLSGSGDLRRVLGEWDIILPTELPAVIDGNAKWLAVPPR